MEVVFLGHARPNGCRTTYYFPHLVGAGVSPRYLEAPPKGLARLDFLKALPACDVALVQRLVLSSAEILALKSRARRLVYDLDDPIQYRSSRHFLRFSLSRRLGFCRMAGAADAVLASSPLIAAEARKVLPSERVFVVPSTVDAEVYRPGPEHPPEGGFVLGWLGSAGTVAYLKRLGRVLKELGRRVPHLRLKVVSNRFVELPGIPLENKPWKHAEEVADLQSFDAGLLPIPDDLWTRGKGHGKLFQYLATGSPVIGSPVGIVAEVVQDGVNGFLPGQDSEWVEAVLRLAGDRALLSRMRRQARDDFVARHSVQASLPVVLKALRG